MTAPVALRHSDNWLLPGSPNDSRLLHGEVSDRIQVCAPHIGEGYHQVIELQDDLDMVIKDITFNQEKMGNTAGRVDFLKFEFQLAGPDAGHSFFWPYFGLKEFWSFPIQQRYFSVEVWLRRPLLALYFQAFMERLSQPAQDAAKRIVQFIYRRQGGGTHHTPMAMLNQIFDRAENFRTGVTLEHLLTDDLYADGLALYDTARIPITPAMEQVIGQILSCPYQGGARRADLKRQALKLLDLYLDARVQRRQGETTGLDYIYQASAILRDQLVHPPTIAALARQVGTNRFYLYQGFQQVYGTTPFGYLRDYRLWQARRLLMASDLSICQVAKAVGYTSRSNFALAFRQQLGLNPKAFQ